MATSTNDISRGTELALGIVLLWFGGLCFFVAFMSGKISALTTTDSGGKSSGPRDVSGLAVAISAAVQQRATKIPTPPVGQSAPIIGPTGQPVGTVTTLPGGDWIVGQGSDF